MPNITVMDLDPTMQSTFKWRKSEKDMNMVKETNLGTMREKAVREGLRKKEAIIRWEAGLTSGGADEPATMTIFDDYRQFGSYMLSLSSRLKNLLNNIKSTADATTRLITLQELSELLSISTENTLPGSFQVELFVKELVKILGGCGVDGGDEDDEDDDQVDQDGDAAFATALAMSTGSVA
jgi:hypothetical protein